LKSSADLVKYCETALAEDWFYGWGAYGQKATTQTVNALISQYPAVNTRWRDYMQKAVAADSRLTDCYGLVKGFLFTDESGKLKYNSAYDVNSAMAYARAKEKGAIETMPEIPGLILHMEGHVGVYAGKGKIIECVGNGVGMTQGQIANGRIISGSNFKHWFKDINIDYTGEVGSAPDKPIIITPNAPSVEKRDIALEIGGKEVIISCIVNENIIYAPLKEIAEALNYLVQGGANG
jgi:hypothetical protein